jgi:hypothetical protein
MVGFRVGVGVRVRVRVTVRVRVRVRVPDYFMPRLVSPPIGPSGSGPLATSTASAARALASSHEGGTAAFSVMNRFEPSREDGAGTDAAAVAAGTDAAAVASLA